MKKVLSQEEINVMVRAARGHQKDDAPRADGRSIKAYSFRQAGQLTDEQVHGLTILHEGFARSLAQSLGAYLRVLFEASLASIEQITYAEFLERVPKVTYMMSFQVRPVGAAAAMQLDHSLVFPLIDIMLGGTGQCPPMNREITEIEEQIVESVARIICHELAVAWASLNTEIELEHRQTSAQMQRFLSAPEKTLCLGFEIKLAEARGTLHLVFPVSISNTLLRRLSMDGSYGKSRSSIRPSRQLAERMMGCSFPITLGITAIKLRVRTLLKLNQGEICNLGIPVRRPASLIIAGREVFEAEAVRHGRYRAAQVGQRLATTKTEKRP
ncbi:MAG TPA: FliM/FliN family flagellar motor switch protein [Terriglobales bacterium]|nr:FliM/FliN family flagellar motor switch protein [Terriglobales bacterium]